MIRLVIIGVGSHSRGNHLPALQRYAQQHPDCLELTALCDLDAARAAEAAGAFSFARSYTDYDTMLRETRPDAIVAVTPLEVTARIATDLMARRIPLLMEKPLGATLDEARQIVAAYEQTQAPVMVSLNRRFEPAIATGRQYLAGRALRHVHVTFLRHRRSENRFITETAIHGLDTACFLAGAAPRAAAITAIHTATAPWYLLRVEFASGVQATLDIHPTAGADAEVYDCFGDGFRLTMRSALYDTGSATAWEARQPTLQFVAPPADPPFVRNGTYAETEAFLAAIAAGGSSADLRARLSPNPGDVLAATRVLFAALAETPAITL